MGDPLALFDEQDDPDLERLVATAVSASGRKVVALDDDPTGVQTVHDVAVLAGWSVDELAAELVGPSPLFFVLTNSRSLGEAEARELNQQLTRNLISASRQTRTEFVVASRSDSTLRGHFPAETDAIGNELGGVDGVLICPSFFEGGRYTVDDVHYIKQGEQLVPVADTEFARDATFGYTTSNLRQWVEEKSNSRISASDVRSLGLDEVRQGGQEQIARRLRQAEGGQPIIVNATCYADLHIVALGLLKVEAEGWRFIYRTGASFVRARAGIRARPLLTRGELIGVQGGRCPGLVVVGSHVRRSGEQLARLLQLDGVAGIEVDVAAILANAQSRQRVIETVVSQMNEAIDHGETTVVFTSRTIVTSSDQLDVSRAVSTALVEIVQGLQGSPSFVIGKGGITSSDIGTKALGSKRAVVLGQIRPGVPVWRLGPEARLPGLPYVVFPGNVGDADTLAEIVAELRGDRALAQC